MPHVINPKECAVCGACEAVCETDSSNLHRSCEYYVVDAETCIDCGECVEVCPTEAIGPDRENPPADPPAQSDQPPPA